MDNAARQLVLSELAAADLQRLLNLLISPVGRAEPAEFGPLAGCWLEAATDDAGVYRRRLAAAVAGHIVRYWVRSTAHTIARNRYRALSPAERAEVVNHAARRMRTNLGRVAGSIVDYLDSEQVLIVEGFATFRVPGLRNDVEDAVDEGADAVMLDREYREFLRMVSGVLGSRPAKIKDVNVVFDVHGRFRLLDRDSRPVSVPGIKVSPDGWVTPGSGERQDTLINALVAVSPRMVVVHLPVTGVCPRAARRLSVSHDLLQTVFGDRMQLCQGCRLCRRLQPVDN